MIAPSRSTAWRWRSPSWNVTLGRWSAIPTRCSIHYATPSEALHKKERPVAEEHSPWFNATRDYTLRLVHIRSVSPSADENEMARAVLRFLGEGDLESTYTALGLDPIAGDQYERANAYAFLHGASSRAIVLFGHIDTVSTADYGALEEYALDPVALSERGDTLAAITPGLADEIARYGDDLLFGRGAIDMKSGVAANITVMRALAERSQTEALPLSIVLLATPDEENESAGVLQGVRFLLRLREEYGLEYVGAINTDYTTALYPGDSHRYAFTGTIGKLLPSFLVIGKESHVGDPFDGVDANLLAAELIVDLSMNPDLCDIVRGQKAPPPVTLHAADLKAGYDVQLPFAATFYLNALTLRSSPAELLEGLRERAAATLTRLLERLHEAEERWTRLTADETSSHPLRVGSVVTLAELREATEARVGADVVNADLTALGATFTSTQDKRERSLRLAQRLWTLSGFTGPAVVLYYSPPYYPHAQAAPGALDEAMAEVAAAHPELELRIVEFYPYISDMSYLRLDPGMDLAALKANMPLWSDEFPSASGAYSLPLDEIARLGLPAINLGPYGWGAHQRGERLLQSYSFGALPQLILEVIERLGAPKGPPASEPSGN
jgi:arginine utilization protein RocB